MKILLTGATGAAGLPILRTLLTDPAVDTVTVLARRPLPTWVVLPDTGTATHPKLTVLPDTDFLNYSPEMRATVSAHDACIWALGKSTRGLSEVAYTELTFGYLRAFVAVLEEAKVGSAEHPFRVVFVSGGGTDSSEKSRILFARVKGRAENMLLASAHASNGAIKATVMRPSYFFPAPADAPHQRSTTERYVHTFLGNALSTFVPRAAISVEVLARFAVDAAKGQWEDQGELFENVEIKRLVQKSQGAE
ncbi:hypothetical protein BV25DRAFT_1919513 [Artomyces pyxidatus]|uniref:Uncharacterized protein n=1 Tax=Artomyces pyxidatus TaxID=48021 RepID=A0ACB8SP47_9AGAM|nr:hypothetical protein BV25DRAFT_1919513 [Artomyces pyxidatus]